jgi:hypothetical protein
MPILTSKGISKKDVTEIKYERNNCKHFCLTKPCYLRRLKFVSHGRTSTKIFVEGYFRIVTQCSWILLETLTVTQLVIKSPALHGTPRSISALATCPWAPLWTVPQNWKYKTFKNTYTSKGLLRATSPLHSDWNYVRTNIIKNLAQLMCML